MNFLIESNNVSKYLEKEYYFKKIKKQLSKDFNDLSFDNELDAIHFIKSNLLLSLIKRFLKQVFQSNPDFFSQLIYRIDIPETVMRQLFLEAEIDFEKLANLVIKRELLKILIRENYSS